MLTWIGTYGALVNILVTSAAGEARRAGADGTAIHWVGVTHCIFMAWVTDASIVQVAKQTSLPHWTIAVEGSHSVMAGGPVETDGCGTVIYVLTTALSSPAIHTDTGVATVVIETGSSIVASIGLQLAFVHIFCAELTSPLRSTLAVVGVDPIHTSPSVHALMAWTVINVDLAVLAIEPW